MSHRLLGGRTTRNGKIFSHPEKQERWRQEVIKNYIGYHQRQQNEVCILRLSSDVSSIIWVTSIVSVAEFRSQAEIDSGGNLDFPLGRIAVNVGLELVRRRRTESSEITDVR